ncbi:hypothetical protein INT47_004895 [Mucor saturninus]|uniref:Uncharacterized protein n=1 Tax=Mucor saturninus TaxID=64648 RepID=A0A8H7QPU1_9FUNG|nr:hypothetical protein INT47_004895 [Mucor saturninus]
MVGLTSSMHKSHAQTNLRRATSPESRLTDSLTEVTYFTGAGYLLVESMQKMTDCLRIKCHCAKVFYPSCAHLYHNYFNVIQSRILISWIEFVISMVIYMVGSNETGVENFNQSRKWLYTMDINSNQYHDKTFFMEIMSKKFDYRPGCVQRSLI